MKIKTTQAIYFKVPTTTFLKSRASSLTTHSKTPSLSYFWQNSDFFFRVLYISKLLWNVLAICSHKVSIHPQHYFRPPQHQHASHSALSPVFLKMREYSGFQVEW